MGMSSSKKAKTSKSPIPANPTSIADFGYHWVQDEGSEDAEYQIRLKPIAGGEFKWEGQQHYDKLAEFVVSSLQDLMQEEFDLERVMLPLEKDRRECPVTFPIFHSKDVLTNAKIIVFVLGAGSVSLGQWSRSLCINKSLAEGSLMPFLHEAIRVRGCGVLLTNPNVNSYIDATSKRLRRIPGNGSPEDHLKYLYKHYLAGAAATEIAIIAHSFGGVSTMTLLSNPSVEQDFFEQGRLKSITLTDSVHVASLGNYELSKRVKKWLLKNSINYVRSGDRLGTKYANAALTQRQSAGTDDHASTSYACRTKLWPFIDARMTPTPLPPLPAKAAAAVLSASDDGETTEEKQPPANAPRRSARLSASSTASHASASTSATLSRTSKTASSPAVEADRRHDPVESSEFASEPKPSTSPSHPSASSLPPPNPRRKSTSNSRASISEDAKTPHTHTSSSTLDSSSDSAHPAPPKRKKT